ncbi:MAG: hypothetical protein ACP5KB_04205 [Thermoprotei archaeon]
MVVSEPFMLYVSKRFVDRASKVFGLGLIVRKPLVDILRKMGVQFTELDRDEARKTLEAVTESKNVSISTAQLVKGLALAFLLPTGVFIATLKKVLYRAGIETRDYVMLEFLAEIPRAFRPTVFYDIWLVIPKSEEGAAEATRILKEIVSRVGAPPLTEEEWRDAEPIREKLAGKIEVRGLTNNLWTEI